MSEPARRSPGRKLQVALSVLRGGTGRSAPTLRRREVQVVPGPEGLDFRDASMTMCRALRIDTSDLPILIHQTGRS